MQSKVNRKVNGASHTSAPARSPSTATSSPTRRSLSPPKSRQDGRSSAARAARKEAAEREAKDRAATAANAIRAGVVTEVTTELFHCVALGLLDPTSASRIVLRLGGGK